MKIQQLGLDYMKNFIDYKRINNEIRWFSDNGYHFYPAQDSVFTCVWSVNGGSIGKCVRLSQKNAYIYVVKMSEPALFYYNIEK